MSEPLISISCMTYNHKAFIRQCLDGFMMQKCSFDFEVLIHDDASTDGTQDIIREYEVKYPDIIKPIYQKENQYSKGIDPGLKYNVPRTKGKYIAFCEGDDYWTDPNKLQKQVDFLENHPDYVMCFHCYKFYFQDRLCYDDTIRPEKASRKGLTFDLNFYISNDWMTQPLTVVFRTEVCKKICEVNYNGFKDVTLFYALLKYGKGYIFPNVWGIYRIHSGGVFTGISVKKRLIGNIKTVKGICEAEKTEISAVFLKNILEYSLQFVGVRFFLQNIKLLSGCILLLKKHIPSFSIYSFMTNNIQVKSTLRHILKGE